MLSIMINQIGTEKGEETNEKYKPHASQGACSRGSFRFDSNLHHRSALEIVNARTSLYFVGICFECMKLCCPEQLLVHPTFQVEEQLAVQPYKRQEASLSEICHDSTYTREELLCNS